MFVAQFVHPLPRRTDSDPSESREPDCNCDMPQTPSTSHRTAPKSSNMSQRFLYWNRIRNALVRYLFFGIGQIDRFDTPYR
jgi:hypothetical protein